VTGRGDIDIRGAARAPRFLSAAAAVLLLAGASRVAMAFPIDAAVSALLPALRYARAAILVDQATGRVLFAEGADLGLPPASLAKLMTLHLVYQKLAERAIDRGDVVWFGPDAYARHQQPGSSLMALEPGQIVTVGELMKGAAIQSGNDAAMALAEFIAGGTGTFVDWMNEESRFLGFRVTRYADPAGVGPGSVVTAREFAEFCREYLRQHPESLAELHSLPEFSYPQAHNLPGGASSAAPTAVTYNHNWLVRGFGVDGLKTGRYDDENFTLAITASRGGLRLVAVLLGVPGRTLGEGSLRRSQDGLALLSWGFRTFAAVEVAEPDPGSLRVWKGEADEVSLEGPVSAVVAVRPDEERTLEAVVEAPMALVAPVRRGQKVGELVFRADGREVARFDLAAAADVAPAGLLKRAWDTVLMTIERLRGPGA
jgi:D-alanyl-D-alanine carboxypeptidase (penicillin-binding protein 5/6)